MKGLTSGCLSSWCPTFRAHVELGVWLEHDKDPQGFFCDLCLSGKRFCVALLHTTASNGPCDNEYCSSPQPSSQLVQMDSALTQNPLRAPDVQRAEISVSDPSHIQELPQFWLIGHCSARVHFPSCTSRQHNLSLESHHAAGGTEGWQLSYAIYGRGKRHICKSKFPRYPLLKKSCSSNLAYKCFCDFGRVCNFRCNWKEICHSSPSQAINECIIFGGHNFAAPIALWALARVIICNSQPYYTDWGLRLPKLKTNRSLLHSSPGWCFLGHHCWVWLDAMIGFLDIVTPTIHRWSADVMALTCQSQ